MSTLSESVSSSLKTALLDKSMDGHAAVEDTRTFYAGGTLYAAHSGSSGWFLATSNAAPPKHFRSDVGDLVRAWEYFELETLLLMVSSFEQQNIAFGYSGEGDINRFCTITIDETDYTGEQLIGSLSNDAADMEAFGKAVLAYVESL